MLTIKVLITRYAVEVYADHDYLGGITDRRINHGVAHIGEAMQEICEGLATLIRRRGDPDVRVVAEFDPAIAGHPRGNTTGD